MTKKRQRQDSRSYGHCLYSKCHSALQNTLLFKAHLTEQETNQSPYTACKNKWATSIKKNQKQNHHSILIQVNYTFKFKVLCGYSYFLSLNFNCYTTHLLKVCCFPLVGWLFWCFLFWFGFFSKGRFNTVNKTMILTKH